LVPLLMGLHPLMGIQSLMGIHEKRAIRHRSIWHPLTLCYPTMRWMWKMLWRQGHPSKCRINTLCTAHVSIPLSESFHFCACDVGDIQDNVGCPHVAPSACRASNSVDVQIVDDEEPYGITRAIDSDDDRPIAAPIEQDRVCLVP
jgi:hypothetical protein